MMERGRAPRKRAGLALAAACLLSACSQRMAAAYGGIREEQGQPVVTLPFGDVQGKRTEDGSIEFLGIPYTAPPQRFEHSKVWTGTYPSGRLNATSYKPECVQQKRGEMSGSEDCLYLNIFVPHEADNNATLLPVMAFIHGGDFVGGRCDMYDGTHLADYRHVIVVTLAYRLGALGFLAHRSMAKGGTGNFGLVDQQTALRWIKDNIQAFGGDPSHLLVFGQSAGAYSVCLHALLPASASMISAAVLESGGCHALPLEAALKRGDQLASDVGCQVIATNHTNNHTSSTSSSHATTSTSLSSSSNSSSGANAAAVLECLKHAPLAKLANSSAVLGHHTYHFFSPVVDGSIVTASAASLLRSHDRPALPVILGSNQDEGSIFVRDTSLHRNSTDAFYQYWVMHNLRRRQGLSRLSDKDLERVLQLYPPLGHNNTVNAERIIADTHYYCPMLYAARHLGPAAYVYHFSYARQACGTVREKEGAFHGAELAYVWADKARTPCKAPFDPTQDFLVRAMQSYWSSLAAHGTPNGKAMPEGALEWPPFVEDSNHQVMQFSGSELSVKPAPHSEACDFWDQTGIYSW